MTDRTSQPAIAPVRTRWDVIYDRWQAGLPFYYHATLADEQIALSHPDRTCMGEPVTIIDQDGEHYVLQRTGGARVQASQKRRKTKKEPDA